MNIFKLKLNVLHTEHKRRQQTIIKRTLEKSVNGVIIEDPSTGVYKVEFNKKVYDIHPYSYKTLGKRRVYRKINNEWIEYDRPCIEDRFDKPGWIPFRTNYSVIGNVIQEGDNIYFKIRTCYNKYNLESKQEAMRIIRNEDLMETINNGDDSSSECTNR